MVKNPPAKAEDTRDVDLIPGSERSPGRKWQPTPVFFAWKIPQTEEADGLQSMESQRVRLK